MFRRLGRALLRLVIIAVVLSVLSIVLYAWATHSGLFDRIGSIREALDYLPRVAGAFILGWFILTILDGDPPPEDREQRF